MSAGLHGSVRRLRERATILASDANKLVFPVMLRRLGVGVAARRRFLAGQRAILLDRLGLDTVLDVGANVGQYATELRRTGFGGTIHSFEPSADALRHLRPKAARECLWHVHELALSDRDGEAVLQTWNGEHSVWSSLHVPAAGPPLLLGASEKQAVLTTTLAAWLDSAGVQPASALLKVDVQGSEREVLIGAAGRLREFAVVEIEAAIRPYYDGEALLPELLDLVTANGFVCASIQTDRFLAPILGSGDVDVLAVNARRLPQKRAVPPMPGTL